MLNILYRLHCDEVGALTHGDCWPLTCSEWLLMAGHCDFGTLDAFALAALFK